MRAVRTLAAPYKQRHDVRHRDTSISWTAFDWQSKQKHATAGTSKESSSHRFHNTLEK